MECAAEHDLGTDARTHEHEYTDEDGYECNEYERHIRDHEIRQSDDDLSGKRHFHAERRECVGKGRHHIDEHEYADDDDCRNHDRRVDHGSLDLPCKLLRTLHLKSDYLKRFGEGAR